MRKHQAEQRKAKREAERLFQRLRSPRSKHTCFRLIPLHPEEIIRVSYSGAGVASGRSMIIARIRMRIDQMPLGRFAKILRAIDGESALLGSCEGDTETTRSVRVVWRFQDLNLTELIRHANQIGRWLGSNIGFPVIVSPFAGRKSPLLAHLQVTA